MSSDHAEHLKAAAAILMEAAHFAEIPPAKLIAWNSPHPAQATYICACVEVMVRRRISFAAIESTLNITLATIEYNRDIYRRYRKDTLLTVMVDHLSQPKGWFHTRKA